MLQRKWEDERPSREEQTRKWKLKRLQEKLSTPWRLQKARVDFDGERLVAIHFDGRNGRSRCDLSRLPDERDLRELSIVMLPLTAEDVEYLVAAKQLERLALTQTGIQDEQLSQLSKLPNLTELNLSEDAVSAKAVQLLQISRPNLSVYGPGGNGVPTNQWTKLQWNSARITIGEEEFQQAIHAAGLEGVVANAPEER